MKRGLWGVVYQRVWLQICLICHDGWFTGIFLAHFTIKVGIREFLALRLGFPYVHLVGGLHDGWHTAILHGLLFCQAQCIGIDFCAVQGSGPHQFSGLGSTMVEDATKICQVVKLVM